MKVININGASQKVCKCGSWIQHWKIFSGESVKVCRALGCSNNDVIGAHVQKDVKYDNNWYIVPLCHYHKHASFPVELESGTKLVSAYKKETCM